MQAVREEFGFEIKTVARQRAKRVRGFKIEKMLGSLSRAQLRFAAGTPAIGFGAEVFDFVNRRLTAQEFGNIRREICRGEPIDHPVTVVAPGKRGIRNKADEECYNGGALKKMSAHGRSITAGEAWRGAMKIEGT